MHSNINRKNVTKNTCETLPKVMKTSRISNKYF